MTEFLTGFFQTNIIINISYILILGSAIFFSLKDHISPVQTLLFILTSTLIFFTVTSQGRFNFLSQIRSDDGFTNILFLIGLLSVLIGVAFTKNILKISNSILHNFPLIVLLVLGIYEITLYFGEFYSLFQYSTDQNLANPIFYEWGKYIHQSTLIPAELYLTNGLLLSIVIAFITTGISWYIYKKLILAKTKLLFAIFIIDLILFITLFNFNPDGVIAINNRILGMNVFQWGIILINILIIAYIIAKETSNVGTAHKLKRLGPSHSLLFFYYVCLTVVAFPLSKLFDSTGLYIFIAGHAITTIYMTFYFFIKTEKSFVRLGTISVILIIWIFFIRSNISLDSQPHLKSPEIETMSSENKS